MRTPTQITAASLRQLAERDERVFPSYPQVARYFPAQAMEDARRRLGRAIERGDGPGLVIGAPGTGKSLLLQVLAAQYHGRFDVVLLAVARICTRRALLQAILFELGLPYKIRDEGELRLSLLDHLLSDDECPAGLLLLVDEAQSLPVSLLDEMRVMSNLVRGGSPRVRLVLAGSAALEESFAHPELESFGQRLAARCYLAPLRRDETSQFVRAQLAESGAAPDETFAANAWDAIFEATDGVPRLVNQLCDRALLLAAADNRQRIDRDAIERAWSDLQQLPTPWDIPTSSPIASTASPVLEFGGLNDARKEQDFVDDAAAPVDPTDLDLDDDDLDLNRSIIASPQYEVATERSAADPFAEEFAEEEVVLDNFAAWDDMFGRDVPRVANRRDPNFATLVQAAIDAAPKPATKPHPSPSLSAVAEFDVDEASGADDDTTESGISAMSKAAPSSNTGQSNEWAPLRLAVVAEPAPLKPIPLVAPAGVVEARGVPSALRPTLEIKRSAGNKSSVEPPILVIEDDSPTRPAHPPVRREEYRHLFSRLRSG